MRVSSICAVTAVVASFAAVVAVSAVAAVPAGFGSDPRAVAVTAVLKATRTPSPQALTLVNVWATWCEPCREEMPSLLRFFRENHAQGFRLILVSIDDDDPEGRGQIRAALREAAEQAHLLDSELVDVQVFLKADNDTTFVNGLDPKWSGALPASFAFAGRGARERSWHGPVTYRDLSAAMASRLTRSRPESKQRSVGVSPPAPKPNH